MSRRRGPAVAVALLAVALAAGAMLLLTTSGPGLAGSNGVPPLVFAETLPSGGEVCSEDVLVPAGAAGARLTLGTYGRPGDVTVTGSSGTRVVLRGRRTFREGVVDVPLAPVKGARRTVRLCVENSGAGRLAVAGRAGAGPSVLFPASPSRRWLDQASGISENLGRGRFLPGGAMLAWLALALTLVAGCAATLVVLRAVDER